MAIARKLRKVLEDHFPPPDKVTLRDEDNIIGIITSKRFRGMPTMRRQKLVRGILTTDLTAEERKHIAIIVAVTPEEEMAYSADEA